MSKELHAILQYTSESEKAKKKTSIRKAGIRSRKSKTERQYNGKKKNDNLQNTAQKTKVRAVRTLLNSVVYTGAPEGWAIPAPHVATVVLLFYKLGDKKEFK